MRVTVLLGAVPVVHGMACGDEGPEVREYRGIGTFSLSARDADTAVLSVTFSWPEAPCLSSCDVNVGSCSAALVDGRVQVQSTLTRTQGSAETCNAACAAASASCELALPPPGNYVFVLDGGRSTTVALPPAAPVPLFR